MKNIVLIGMPGSGKSTTGVVLAKTLGMSFTDTDLIISKNAGKKLQDILDTDGIPQFLVLEGNVGTSLDCENTVIATGGSMVKCEKAMKNLKSIGTVIYLDVSLDEIKRRVNNIKTRGIVFDVGKTLDDLYYDRTPLYKKYADITIDCSKDTLENTIEKISELVNN